MKPDSDEMKEEEETTHTNNGKPVMMDSLGRFRIGHYEHIKQRHRNVWKATLYELNVRIGCLDRGVPASVAH